MDSRLLREDTSWTKAGAVLEVRQGLSLRSEFSSGVRDGASDRLRSVSCVIHPNGKLGLGVCLALYNWKERGPASHLRAPAVHQGTLTPHVTEKIALFQKG